MKRDRHNFTITETTVERLAANGQIYSLSPAHPTHRSTSRPWGASWLTIAIVCIALLIAAALLVR